jgi:type I restriction enzyme S subunit
MTATNPMTSRALAVWWKDLERWVIPSSILLGQSLPKGWGRVRVESLVRQVTKRIKADPDHEYKMAGVKWYGEGLFHRETVRGDAMSATYVTPLVTGALIYNRLFAWKASFAVVTPEFADCYVSSEFPQFIPDLSRVLPEYLYLFCTRIATIRAVNSASIGSSAVSRNRFKEDEFLNFEISLPPLTEQKAIVARWRKAQNDIAAARKRMADLVTKIQISFLAHLGLKPPVIQEQPKAFAVWWKDIFALSARATFLSITNVYLNLGKYTLLRGRDCLTEVRHGCSSPPSPKPTELEILKISAVTRGIFVPTEKKYAFDNARVRKEFDLRKGDVLLCRTNGTLAYVGMSALVLEDMTNLIYPDKVIRVRVNESILPEYLWQVLQSHPLRAQIEAVARTAVGNYAIGSEDIWNLQIPVPPLAVQKEIVERIAMQRREIAREREAAERLSRNVDAEVEALILGTRTIKGA